MGYVLKIASFGDFQAELANQLTCYDWTIHCSSKVRYTSPSIKRTYDAIPQSLSKLSTASSLLMESPS